MIRGITGSSILNKVIFGPGGSDIVINAPTSVDNVPGYASLYPGAPQDIICRNLTINDQLLPVAKRNPSGEYACYKIICSGTLTLNSGAGIRADGSIPNGFALPGATGALGFAMFSAFDAGHSFGTIGGSGSGGDAASGADGLPGGPRPADQATDTWVCLGGSGASGSGAGGHSGGAAGVSAWNFRTNSMFQPSVYNDMVVWGNQDSNAALLFPRRITGGAGGGGGGGIGGGIGGGAAGGGVVYCVANRIVFNNGHIGAPGGISGPGGAGGGGAVVLVAGSIEWPAASYNAIDVTGANPGNVLMFSNDLVARFSGGTVSRNDFEAAVIAYQS